MGQHLLAVRRSAAAPLLRLGGQQRQPPRVAPAQLLAAPLEACDAPQRLGARGALAPIPRLRLDVAAAPNAAPHAPATAAATAATADCNSTMFRNNHAEPLQSPYIACY